MKRPTPEHPIAQLLDSVAASDGSTLPTDAELRAVATDEAGGHPKETSRLQRELRAASLEIARHAGLGHAGDARTVARETAAALANEKWTRHHSGTDVDIAAIVDSIDRRV